MSFLKGNIYRIYLENFLTYNKIEIKPKPHLNVIIGPNGTGKSSILCGICLGLGGKPELTGRGKSLVEYVKNGEDHSKIEIELFNPNGDNYVIQRVFSKAGNGKSKWYLQGYDSTEEKVREFVIRLGIQVNNLCQFLPQDRVIEFAKMNKIELLLSTEKAIGEIELFEQHKKLQDYGKSQQDANVHLKGLKDQLNNEIRKNKQLEDQVKNIKAKEELEKSILGLEQVLLFCNYNKFRSLHQNLGETFKNALAEKESIENRLKPNKEKLEEIKKKSKETNKFLTFKREKLREMKKRHNTLVTHVKNEENNIEIAKEDYKNSHESAARRMSGIEKLKQRRNLLQTQLVDSQFDESELRQEIQNLTLLISTKSQDLEINLDKIGDMERKKQSLSQSIQNCNFELSEIRDRKNRKLQKLNFKHRNVYLASEWLQNNRNKPGLFKGVIHDPLFTTIECANEYSKYLENVVSKQDLIAFACEEKEDVRTLKLEANKLKLPINVLYTPPVNPNQYQSKIKIEVLRPLGFENYLRDLINAPPSIMSFLCRNYNIYNIPIAQNADSYKIPGDINLYFIGNVRYSKKRSRYDGKKSNDVSDINAPYFLVQASNSGDEERLLLQLEKLKEEEQPILENITSLREEKRDIEVLLDKLRRKKSESDNILSSRQNIKVQLEVTDTQLRQRESNNIDLHLEKQKMNDSIRDCVLKMVKACKHMSSAEDDMRDLNELVVENYFTILDFQSKEKHIIKSMESDQLEATAKSEEIAKVRQEKEITLKKAKDFFSQLLKSIGVPTADMIPQEVKEDLKKKSTNKSIDELERRKIEKEVQISCLVVSNENVLEEYDKRKEEIANFQSKINKLERDLENKTDNIKEVREVWLRGISLLTAKISEFFSQYMFQLGCAGEVHLDTGSDENDFSKYGLSIKVKFRDTEKLKELAALQQSGGERSLTTALFLLALQHTPTSPVPFRCVDEINQGMDHTNERKMFTMLVESMTETSAKQYFFVSPKLLPNLPYNSFVSSLNIFNWSSSVKIQSISSCKIIRRIKESKKNKRKRN